MGFVGRRSRPGFRGQGELFMGMHLGAPVPGQSLVEVLWQLAGVLDERFDDCL